MLRALALLSEVEYYFINIQVNIHFSQIFARAIITVLVPQCSCTVQGFAILQNEESSHFIAEHPFHVPRTGL